MTVTRMDIADCVSAAFDAGETTKTELMVAARAHPGVLNLLQGLPEQRYRNMRELWPHLSAVPVAR